MRQEKWCYIPFHYLKGGYKKEGNRLFGRVCGNRIWENGFKLKDDRQVGYNEEVSYSESGEAQAHVAQRSGGCPLPEDIQGQNGWGSEYPHVAVGVPVHCSGVGLMTYECTSL